MKDKPVFGLGVINEMDTRIDRVGVDAGHVANAVG